MELAYLLPHDLQRSLDEGWPLLIPAGCVEYHGPHLPLGVDTLIVENLLREVAARVDCVTAPALAYGPTGYAVTGPDQGTLDVSTERFGRHAKDVLAAFWEVGFRWIIVCVHHQQMEGPEALSIRQAAAEVTFERTRAQRGDAWWGKAPLARDDRVFERIQVWPSVLPEVAEKGVQMADHAGYFETALMLGCRPELVAMERLGPGAPWFTDAPGSRAREAGREAGQRMWQAMVDAWAGKLAALRPRRPTPNEVTISGLF